MKIKTIVEQEVTPPVYLDYDGEVDCIKSTDDMLSVNPGKLITRADYIYSLVKENTGQPLTTQDLDDLRALIEPKQAFKFGDQVVLGEFESSEVAYWPDTPPTYARHKKNYVGTIAAVDHVFLDEGYRVKLHDGNTAWWHPSGMKPWTPRPPKVGDLVRTDEFNTGTEGVVRIDFFDKFLGKIGIVTDFTSKSNPIVHGWAWPSSALTIIKPTP